jgi:hypothetical protein
MPKTESKQKKALVRKAPLGSFPPGQCAASTPHGYNKGDIVFWATLAIAGEYRVIGYLKDEPDDLVFDNEGELPTKACQTRGRSNLPSGRGNRQRISEGIRGRLVRNP